LPFAYFKSRTHFQCVVAVEPVVAVVAVDDVELFVTGGPPPVSVVVTLVEVLDGWMVSVEPTLLVARRPVHELRRTATAMAIVALRIRGSLPRSSAIAGPGWRGT